MTTRSQAKREAKLDSSVSKATRGKSRKFFSNAKKFLSWNMQGSSVEKLNFLRRKMEDPLVSAIALQECGDLGGWTNEQLQKEHNCELRMETWSADAGTTGKGNNRCSMAIITKEPILGQNKKVPVSERRRPIITTRFATWKISNVHAPRANVAYMEEATEAGMINHEHIPGIVVGDMNLPPRKLARIPSGTSVVSSGQATHIGGSEIDWAVCSDALDVEVGSVEFQGGSDHAVMTYIINNKP